MHTLTISKADDSPMLTVQADGHPIGLISRIVVNGSRVAITMWEPNNDIIKFDFNGQQVCWLCWKRFNEEKETT
jgi:hypothetical protein